MPKKKLHKIQLTKWRNYRTIAVVILFASMATGIMYFVFAESPDYTMSADQIKRINQHRTFEHNTAPVSVEPCLQIAAEAWSYEMAKREKLYHSRGDPNRDTDDVYKGDSGWTDKYCMGGIKMGENVGQSYSGSSSKLFKAFLDSPTHHQIIDDRDYLQVGVGSYRSNRGHVYVTHIFCLGCISKTYDPGTTPMDTQIPVFRSGRVVE